MQNIPEAEVGFYLWQAAKKYLRENYMKNVKPKLCYENYRTDWCSVNIIIENTNLTEEENLGSIKTNQEI